MRLVGLGVVRPGFLRVGGREVVGRSSSLASVCPVSSGQSKSTALGYNPHLGWADITHPFHPLHGQRYKILKSRQVSGKDTLILEDPNGGTFAVDRDWTNMADPCPAIEQGQPRPILDHKALLKLAILVQELGSDAPIKT